MEGTRARTPSWAVLVTTTVAAATVVVEVLVVAMLVAVVVEAQQHSSSSRIPKATHRLPNTHFQPIRPSTTRHLAAAMAMGMVMEVVGVGVVVEDIEAATEEVTGGNWEGLADW